ncbi:hypothetical protein V9T40_009541 [Parthenolecanium corni]|uniref:Uncharacterized protein n=1 Tax=Parthenolecanium corni TaxID=536013 RepID=A0AAN9TMZ0_9HEMI
MPPLREVQSLYFLCLDRVFESLFDEIVLGIVPSRLEKIRHHLIANLHGGIREHILKLAVLRDRNRIEVLLQLINILIDPNITYLCCYSGRTFRILPKHYSTLITYLKMRNAVGLKFLHIVIKEQTVMEFILQFKDLRLLGDLFIWGIPDKMVRNIKNKLRSKNLDITLLWNQNCESVVTMNSLRGMVQQIFIYCVNLKEFYAEDCQIFNFSHLREYFRRKSIFQAKNNFLRENLKILELKSPHLLLKKNDLSFIANTFPRLERLEINLTADYIDRNVSANFDTLLGLLDDKLSRVKVLRVEFPNDFMGLEFMDIQVLDLDVFVKYRFPNLKYLRINESDFYLSRKYKNNEVMLRALDLTSYKTEDKRDDTNVFVNKFICNLMPSVSKECSKMEGIEINCRGASFQMEAFTMFFQSCLNFPNLRYVSLICDFPLLLELF